MNRSDKKGLEPGSLVYVGPAKSHKTEVWAWSYNELGCDVMQLHTLDEIYTWIPTREKFWLEVKGIHEKDVVEAVGSRFEIEPLVLEDIMNVAGRPKVDEYADFRFISIKAVDVTQPDNLRMEQFSLVLMNHGLVTFEENQTDSFDSVRDRLKKAKSKLSQAPVSYLAYSLLDNVVDDYLKESEQFGRRIDLMESLITKQAREEQLKLMLKLRRELLDFKKSMDPIKEIIHLLSKEENQHTHKYFVDLYDHILFVSDNLTFHIELLRNTMELYHALLGEKTNKTMRVLTIITTVFVPLTFIVGVYGMNFDYMPELHWKAGYMAVWSIMIVVVFFQLWFFKRQRWM
jgi:magnesium transporter